MPRPVPRLGVAMIAALAVAALAAIAPQARAAVADPIAGVPAEKVGVHGPTEHHLANLELVGHAPMHTPDLGTQYDGLGNNGGVALIGDCAYVGRWHDYSGIRKRAVQIVDVNAASPTFLDVVGEVADTNISGATVRELRAVDLDGFQLLAALTFSDSITNRPERKYNTLRFYRPRGGDCRDMQLVGMYDFLGLRPHEFYLWLDPDRSHDVDGHPRMLAYVTLPITGNLFVVDASNPARPLLAAAYDAGIPVASAEEEAGTYIGNYIHSVSVSPDGRRAFLSYWDAGFLTVDTSDLALGLPGGAIRPLGAASVPYDYSPPDRGNTHSAVIVPDPRDASREIAVVGDEIYATTDGCPYGWLRTLDPGDATRSPSQVGEFRLAENRPEACDADGVLKLRNSEGARVDGTFSAHNQTVGGRFAFVSWYGGGMRVVDLTDPAQPVEAGAFVPKPLDNVRTSLPQTSAPISGRVAGSADDWWVETWSYPVIRDGLIYVTDIRNGLFVLRPTAGAPFAAEVAGTRFLEGNSNLGHFS